MAGKERHMYPGNNTPEGFFSYYQYILSQEEANRIICIKGGPGVGKSTFMKRIGEEMLEDGHDLDFMHCSSDNNSLDGIVIRDMKIALIDGTSPHVVDPINPGAVDSIIHLGDFWNEDGIRKNKQSVVATNKKVQSLFGKTYNYISAAGKMYDNLASIQEEGLKKEELYKQAARILHEELAHKEIGTRHGDVKKYFASAITPNGITSYLDSLITGYSKVYVLHVPIGLSGEKLLQLFMEGSLSRGFDVECYYCPMKPATKLEHLLVPNLSIAFISSNQYHTPDLTHFSGEINNLYLNDYINTRKISYAAEIAAESKLKFEELLADAIKTLVQAKKEHDFLETNYIPNMDFGRLEQFRKEIMQRLQ